jgi:hypothetical protein
MHARVFGLGWMLLCLAVARPAVADDAAWNWRLAGVIVGPGVSRALFARDGETSSVAEGRRIDGWTLAAVRPDGVTLAGPAGTRILSVQAPEAAAGVALRAGPTAPTVAAAARAQQQDQAAAERALAVATRQMQLGTGARSER